MEPEKDFSQWLQSNPQLSVLSIVPVLVQRVMGHVNYGVQEYDLFITYKLPS